MIEFNCAYCGNVKRVHSLADASKFCSKSCAAKWGNEQRYGTEEDRKITAQKRLERRREARRLKRKERETNIIKAPAPELFGCVFQSESILCDRQICSRCGWNPDVAKARLEEIIEKRNDNAGICPNHRRYDDEP